MTEATITIKPTLNWLNTCQIVKPRVRKASPVTRKPPKHLRKAIIHKVEQISKIKHEQPTPDTITLGMVKQAMGI